MGGGTAAPGAVPGAVPSGTVLPGAEPSGLVLPGAEPLAETRMKESMSILKPDVQLGSKRRRTIGIGHNRPLVPVGAASA